LNYISLLSSFSLFFSKPSPLLPLPQKRFESRVCSPPVLLTPSFFKTVAHFFFILNLDYFGWTHPQETVQIRCVFGLDLVVPAKDISPAGTWKARTSPLRFFLPSPFFWMSRGYGSLLQWQGFPDWHRIFGTTLAAPPVKSAR